MIAWIGASTHTIEFHAASNAALGVPNCNFANLLPGTHQHQPDAVRLGFRRRKQLPAQPEHPHQLGCRREMGVAGIHGNGPLMATGKQLTLYSTSPLTYYVDLDSMPNSPGSSATFTQTMQALDSFIRTTLLQNVPVIDKIALFQATTGRSQVADPLRRLVGVGADAKVTRSFPTPATQSRRMLDRVDLRAGARHLSRHRQGQAPSKFQADFTVLQLLGHGFNPIIKTISWKALLGRGGAAASKFPEAGQAVAPVPQAHENHTRVGKGQQVAFNLHHSVVPFIPAKVAWSFGDGSKSTISPTVHRYKRAGHFVPEVTVTNSLGYSVTVQLHEIVVTGSPGRKRTHLRGVRPNTIR